MQMKRMVMAVVLAMLMAIHVPGQAAQRFSDSAEGLRLFLLDGVVIAKSGNKNNMDSYLGRLAIPFAFDWYTATYGGENGYEPGQRYMAHFESYRPAIQESIQNIAGKGGEIITRQVNEHPQPGAESKMLYGLKRPTNFYCAEWRKARAAGASKDELIGYFIYSDGLFRVFRVSDQLEERIERLDSSEREDAAERIVPNGRGGQSISGTKYANPKGHFTLVIPEGWKTDEDIANGVSRGIGGLTDSDRLVSVTIQMEPEPDGGNPAGFLEYFDEQGPTVVHDYKKISASHMTLGGHEAASLVFTLTEAEPGLGGIAMPTKKESFLVAVRVKDKDKKTWDIIFTFATTQSVFGSKEATFRSIVNSFHVDE
jgi:hypothetical protein